MPVQAKRAHESMGNIVIAPGVVCIEPTCPGSIGSVGAERDRYPEARAVRVRHGYAKFGIIQG